MTNAPAKPTDEQIKIAQEIVEFVEGKRQSPYTAPEVPTQLYTEEISQALAEAAQAAGGVFRWPDSHSLVAHRPQDFANGYATLCEELIKLNPWILPTSPVLKPAAQGEREAFEQWYATYDVMSNADKDIALDAWQASAARTRPTAKKSPFDVTEPHLQNVLVLLGLQTDAQARQEIGSAMRNALYDRDTEWGADLFTRTRSVKLPERRKINPNGARRTAIEVVRGYNEALDDVELLNPEWLNKESAITK